MPPSGTSRAAVRALLCTFALDFLTKLAEHFVIIYVAKSLKEHFMLLPEDIKEAFKDYPDISPDTEFFTYNLLYREIASIILLPLQYQWNIRLETMLPVRKRPNQNDSNTQAQSPDHKNTSEELEDEVMRRLIDKGKVQRSSISWRNTFLKMVVQLAVGTSLFYILRDVIVSLLHRHSWSRIFYGALGDIPVHVALQFFTIIPFAYLVAFTVVPARHRLLFIAASQLVQSMFFFAGSHAFLTSILRWLAASDEMQDAFRFGRDVASFEKELQEAGGAALNATFRPGITVTVHTRPTLEVGEL